MDWSGTREEMGGTIKIGAFEGAYLQRVRSAGTGSQGALATQGPRRREQGVVSETGRRESRPGATTFSGGPHREGVRGMSTATPLSSLPPRSAVAPIG